MMKSVLIASLLVGASAFAPSKDAATSSALSMGYSTEVGATAPLGFFDPLGLSKEGTDSADFNRMREAEVRHGRVAMLAVTGWLTTAAGVRLPGMESMPFGFKALNAIQDQPMEVRGCVPFALGTAFFLTTVMQDVTGDSEFPGDYRNGLDFGWDSQTDEWKTKKRTVELNNGRAAQMGILGIMVHEQLGNLNELGLPQP
ncbi:Fucoxanthin-chlorophyll a-c binding protein [Seminavis robusta]|uniref:Fucoxanthin-chlorophyll a-c binding protein n=1 Tax=Seminavis robusta TaxID=568900 RepID=A0A9N8ENB0_9STRA|nr:Fucoxanthin-chlorophyll a-c binding protein [Seminavis robusta]|eukprot:Sro1418_g271000.1 Fucoxanthin-chlorophyll a-c binding protein (200) ;mRNA; f:18800-19399